MMAIVAILITAMVILFIIRTVVAITIVIVIVTVKVIATVILIVLVIGIVSDQTQPDHTARRLEAKVVAIFKGKGSDTHPGNYRPVALLNVVYNILAAMIQARLATCQDADLRATQYGFRRHKGAQHPLFVLRRAMEWANLTNRSLKLLFLDWKQAFDSLDHTAMLTALRRFGVPDTELQLTRHFLYQCYF